MRKIHNESNRPSLGAKFTLAAGDGLIADDDHTAHIRAGHVLSRHGFEILHAYDGKDALRQAIEQQPEVVLLDITMPEMDGRDVCKAIKADAATRHIKVVMVTGKDQQHDRLVGLEAGADDYLDKPIAAISLEILIRSLLRKI